jgi:hypothetical protein
LGIVPPREKIIDGFLQRIVFSKRPNLQRNNPEKNNYPPSKATPEPIILSCSLYHGVGMLALLSGFLLGDDIHDLAAGRIDDQNTVARYLDELEIP